MSTLIDGRYAVLKQLGSGSMGVVYLAEDMFLGRQIAIKVIDPIHASDTATTDRFVKEARALAQIRHPNVVQVYAFGPHQASFFFAMEYVAGRPLEEMVDAGETVDAAGALDVLRAVASGLDAVHAKKLVHRDVKPSNIVIEEGTGRPVLIDFGLARRKSVSNPRFSIAAGTPTYMAPEQSSDPEGTRVTSRADIYALAATAYELLAGVPVFEGRDVFEILQGHLKRPAPPISARRPDLAAFDPAFARALAKDPAARQESATAFVTELDSAMKAMSRTVNKDTLVPTSSVRPTEPTERAIVLGRDDGFVRQVGRVTRRWLGAAGRGVQVAQVTSGQAALDSFVSEPAALLVIDDEATGGALAEIVARLRAAPGGATAGVIVVSRDIVSVRAAVAPLGVRDVLPKPLSVQMLQGAIERVAKRRATPDSNAS